MEEEVVQVRLAVLAVLEAVVRKTIRVVLVLVGRVMLAVLVQAVDMVQVVVELEQLLLVEP